jgi:hypothetical protein
LSINARGFIMPIVTVSGIPAETPNLQELRAAIRRAIANVEELGLTEKQVTVFFPTDLLPSDTCELVAIVCGLFKRPERTQKVRQRVANTVGYEIRNFAMRNAIPYLLIEVLLTPPFIQENGFWSLAQSKTNI